MEHICTLPGLVSPDTCRQKVHRWSKLSRSGWEIWEHTKQCANKAIRAFSYSEGGAALAASSNAPGRTSHCLGFHSDRLLLVCASPTHEVILPPLSIQTHVLLMCFPLKIRIIKIEKRKHQDEGKTNLKDAAYGGPWLLADDCTPTELHSCSFLLHIFHPAVWICHAKATTWNASQILPSQTRLLQNIPKTGTHQPQVVLHLLLVPPLPEAQPPVLLTTCLEITGDSAQSLTWGAPHHQPCTGVHFTGCMTLQASLCSLQHRWCQNLSDLARRTLLIYFINKNDRLSRLWSFLQGLLLLNGSRIVYLESTL